MVSLATIMGRSFRADKGGAPYTVVRSVYFSTCILTQPMWTASSKQQQCRKGGQKSFENLERRTASTFSPTAKSTAVSCTDAAALPAQSLVEPLG